MSKHFSFFTHFIPLHTVDLTSIKETRVRSQVTRDFLSRYPVKDAGLEIVTFRNKLGNAHVRATLENLQTLSSGIEDMGATPHFSLHLPYTPDMALFLGSREPSVQEEIEWIMNQALEIANNGIEVIVLHAGGVVGPEGWDAIKNEQGWKEGVLDRIQVMLSSLLYLCEDRGYDGCLALENMPYPFDIPQFSTTSMITSDLTAVVTGVKKYTGKLGRQLGYCLDLCHSWILSRSARYFKAIHEKTGEKVTPRGIFTNEWEEFIALADIEKTIDAMGKDIVHVHVADSRGAFSLDVHGNEVKPTEGSELGTGDYTRSPEFSTHFERIAGLKPASKTTCTLEIKDTDFSNPVKTGRSLNYLGKRFF